MTFGQRIKTYRQQKGLSQEKVAQLVGVSRQAVGKWEADQSAPSTENLLKLAEILGCTVEALLSEEEQTVSPADELFQLLKEEEAQKAAAKKQRLQRNLSRALLVALGYLGLYLLGRVLWCGGGDSSLLGWLFTERPSGKDSYLYSWLLSSHLYWYAAAISLLPALWGKGRFSAITLLGFVLGLVAGIIFGPNPQGAALGQGHIGWAIWGACYILSMALGLLAQRWRKGEKPEPQS